MTQNENIAEIANEIRSIKYAFIGKDREKVEALEKLALRVEALSLKGEEVNTCQNERCGATLRMLFFKSLMVGVRDVARRCIRTPHHRPIRCWKR